MELVRSRMYLTLTAAAVICGAALMAQAPGTAVPAQAGTPTGAKHVFLRVISAASTPLSGRILIFVKKGSGDKEINAEEFHPEETSVTAKEVTGLLPGQAVEIDADEMAFPRPFSAITPGGYEAQAVLDSDHNYNYGGRDPQDWISTVTELPRWTPGAGVEPVFTLDHHPEPDPRSSERIAKAMAGVSPGVAQKEEFTSPLLSAFWGHPVQVKAWVILPPGYAAHTQEHYPTVYWTHGFGGRLEYALVQGEMLRKRMDEGRMPPMIWVMLDESCAQGTHEFADSVNNGPWGAALTSEFIPQLEARYRMDATASGRLLNGHSSGGWATLQLQVNYPHTFGGTWSTSPDPSDFHDFTGSDLYAAHANVYHGANGSPTPIMRMDGKVVATFEQFARLEAVLGPYGGQVSSFDWVFSPRGNNGAPVPMFDRETGAVDPAVAAYWREHYDLAHIVESRWPAMGSEWKGRFHLYVGTADTFYLDGAAHRFEAVLTKLNAEPHFTYLPGRSHSDVYKAGEDRYALFDEIAGAMYAVARPATPWKSSHGN